jgi:hypothetical protein
MKKRPFRESVRIEFHHSEGLTRVVYDRIPFSGVDIPTDIIPVHLRRIGSRFVIVGNSITTEEADGIDEIRAAISVRIEELIPE